MWLAERSRRATIRPRPAGDPALRPVADYKKLRQYPRRLTKITVQNVEFAAATGRLPSPAAGGRALPV